MEIEIFKMKYKIENSSEGLIILGEDFVKNNRNKGKLIIGYRKCIMEATLSIDNLKKNKIKMILNKNIYNKCCMFKNCVSLESLFLLSIDNYVKYLLNEDYEENSIFEEEDHEQILENKEDHSLEDSYKDIDNSSILYNITTNELSMISDISLNNTINSDKREVLSWTNRLQYYQNIYARIKEIFYNCKSLTSLDDIFNGNSVNIIDMSYMFSNCESLTNLPDLSKWNIGNVIDISSIFYNCKSLNSLPDISKWNTKNIIYMSYLFSNCESLSSLPNISKWNTNNVIDMSYIFSNCEKLQSFF